MERFISKEKLSKKSRHALDSKHRKVWGINPVTRREPDPRAYNRSKNKRENYLNSCNV